MRTSHNSQWSLMRPGLFRPNAGAHHERGVVLLAAIAVLVLLAISSAAYLQLASLDRQIGESTEPDMDLLQSAIISKLESALLDDMEFDDPNFHANGSDWWDYPYTNDEASFEVTLQDGGTDNASGGKWDDMWLASTVMDFDLNRDGNNTGNDGDGDGVDDDFGWRHLSNMEGIMLRLPRRIEADKDGATMPAEYAIDFSSTDDPVLRSDTDVTYNDLLKSVFTGVESPETETVDSGDVSQATTDYGGDWPDQWYFDFDVSGSLITDGDTLDVYEPLGADADGDGVPDSFWTWAPIRSLGAYSYVAAYRVVDLSSMIPVNSISAGSNAADMLIRDKADRDIYRGYFPNHLDAIPLWGRLVDTNGVDFNNSDIDDSMQRLMARYGFLDADNDGESEIDISMVSSLYHGMDSLVSEYVQNANDHDGPNNDNGKLDRFPFKGGSASLPWYKNPEGNDEIDNNADYFTNVIRFWGSKAPYSSTDNTYELLYRFGLNRDDVNPTFETDLDQLVRADAGTETNYRDVVGSVDTRGDLIKWFIGEDTGASSGLEQQTAVGGRLYYDLRKMMTTHSGGLKIKSPIVDTNGSVTPDVTFSFNPQNRTPYWDNSNQFFTHDGEANNDELIGFYLDWFNVVDKEHGWWFERLETSRNNTGVEEGTNNNAEDINPFSIGRNLVNSISDYADNDNAMGEAKYVDGEDTERNDQYHGMEKLPLLGEVYFQQAYSINTDSDGNKSWKPKSDTDHQTWVFELRNPYMQPITVADLNARRYWNGNAVNDSYRFEIMVTRLYKDFDNNNHPQWVFSPDWTASFWENNRDDVVIPPDGVAFFVYEKNPEDEHDYANPSSTTTLDGTGGSVDDLNLPTVDKYGRAIQQFDLRLSQQDVGDNSPNLNETRGEYTYPRSRTDRRGKLNVALFAPSEGNNENTWRRRKYDTLHHNSFKVHQTYPVDSSTSLPDDFTQNLQLSIARDCRGRRYIANPRNEDNSGWDDNTFVKQRLLPDLTSGVSSNYAGAFISNKFCTVTDSGVAGDNGYAVPDAGMGGLIHQLGRNAKAIDDSGKYIRLAEPKTAPNEPTEETIQQWEAALDALQLSNIGRPMLSETELMMIPAMHFNRNGRGDNLVTSELFGNARDSNDDNGSADNVQLDPRMYMWNLDYQAAFLGFDTNGVYIGSKVTVAPPGGTLMDYLDVLGYANDGENADASGLTDDKGDMVVPYRININTAPLHVMTLASPLNEPEAEREALFRQIERFRDGVDGTIEYDGVTGTTLGTVKAVRSAMTGLPEDAFDGQKTDGLPGIKSLSELLWMNPSLVDDESQDMAGSTNLSHITDNAWGDMQRYGYDGVNNAGSTVDNYPYHLDYSGSGPSSSTYEEDRDGDGSPETYTYYSVGTGTSKDDFHDAAIDDNEERLHRYQYLTGTYSTRSDFFVLYAFLRAYRTDKFNEGAIGSRRFMAVFDRHEGLDGKVSVLGGTLLVR